MGYEEQPQVVEHATLFLFWLLVEQRVVTVASKMRVRGMFGSIFETKFTKIHQCVAAVRELLEDFQLDALKQWNRKTNRDAHDKKSWGTNIRIRLKGPLLLDLQQLQDLAPNAQLKKNAAVNFNMQWNNEEEQHRNAENESELSQLLELSATSGDPKLVAKVSEQLSSKRTNNELQNELIELLGFERFNLIGTLLEQRTTISAVLEKHEKREQQLLQLNKMAKQRNTNINEMRPTVASQNCCCAVSIRKRAKQTKSS
ncbi:activating signal cointegrator 1 complex subunit 3-like [Eurosta solidaginis]|uniref:activating signal cointegrator 1 complex subunit 3-like n=1 Tax=Eurosta solidaginis TaxID=178769 RepID=UPI0035305B0E